jgi:hypothetical protein
LNFTPRYSSDIILYLNAWWIQLDFSLKTQSSIGYSILRSPPKFNGISCRCSRF